MRRSTNMDETITLSARQKSILNTLAQIGELSREQIAQKIESHYPISKATLARDLGVLIKKGFIVSKNSGPARIYSATHAHPLLKFIDLNQYFSTESDRKIQNTAFPTFIYNQLPGVILPDELKELDQVFRSFSKSADLLDPTLVQRELERFIIELSWKSSKIEGNTYSLLETETLIKQSRQASGKTQAEATMILNHKEAFRIILDHKQDFQKLSLDLITQLHNTLTKDLDISPGLRRQSVGITGTSYRPPDNQWQIREYLDDLIQVVNSIDHPLEKALITASMISFIQPFTDGNKRTSRMLSNAILLAHDYFPLSYRSLDETEYKMALILFYETQNLYHFKRLFLAQYRFALSTYFLPTSQPPVS